jgi:hypothetical protein
VRWEPDKRRRDAARMLARYGPDLDILVARLSRDERIGLRARIPIRAVDRYMSLRDRVVPDWMPFARRFDDAVHSALVLRFVLRGTNEEMLREAWPGPDLTLDLVLVAIGLADSAPRPKLPLWR